MASNHKVWQTLSLFPGKCKHSSMHSCLNSVSAVSLIKPDIIHKRSLYLRFYVHLLHTWAASETYLFTIHTTGKSTSIVYCMVLSHPKLFLICVMGKLLQCHICVMQLKWFTHLQYSIENTFFTEFDVQNNRDSHSILTNTTFPVITSITSLLTHTGSLL